MTKLIEKFVLETTDTQSIEMPVGARIISLQTQNEKPCIWAIVDVKAENGVRVFEIYGTGNPFYEDVNFGKEFIGTYQLRGGALVFHVFVLNKKRTYLWLIVQL